MACGLTGRQYLRYLHIFKTHMSRVTLTTILRPLKDEKKKNSTSVRVVHKRALFKENIPVDFNVKTHNLQSMINMYKSIGLTNIK